MNFSVDIEKAVMRKLAAIAQTAGGSDFALSHVESKKKTYSPQSVMAAPQDRSSVQTFNYEK